MLDHSLSDVPERGFMTLCGAGISMAPPTSLPSWWEFNHEVLRGLADRLQRDSSANWVGKKFEDLIERRESLRSFTPDFMAQLMEEEVGTDYFRVLSALDADDCNANHLTLAALAKHGVLRAIVTTNFDRLIERALESEDVSYELFATPAAFEQLADIVQAKDHPLILIKAHGTVEDPTTMVDTLAQRVKGRPEALESAITTLLRTHRCLTLGFSGADLAYDRDYLGLRPAADDGIGLVALIRPGTAPPDPMADLLAAWGCRGSTIEGELPGWLAQLATHLGVETPPVDRSLPHPDWSDRLASSVTTWIDSLGTVSAVNMFTSLIDATSDDDNMLRYLMFYRRYYRSTEDAQRPQYWRFEYNLGRRLLDRGLIGTVDPRRAGVVPDGHHDIEAQAYVDAFQFLARAATQGDLPEGHADLVRLLAIKKGHGAVRGNVRQLTHKYLNGTSDRSNFEIALLAAEFAEEFGQVENAAIFIQYAVAVAHEMGDEPRKAVASARAARIAALDHEYEVARNYAEDARVIGERLSLPVVVGDALAAKGMVAVLSNHDADALDPLRYACAVFRRMDRRPRLLYALCDLIRASYYTGSLDETDQTTDEAIDLANLLPGLGVQVMLSTLEIAEHSGHKSNAVECARDLLSAAETLKHSTGVRRARDALARLGEPADV